MIINGKDMDIPAGTSVTALLGQLKLTPEKVVVEINREIVTADKWDNHRLNTGDKIEIVAFVGGG